MVVMMVVVVVVKWSGVEREVTMPREERTCGLGCLRLVSSCLQIVASGPHREPTEDHVVVSSTAAIMNNVFFSFWFFCEMRLYKDRTSFSFLAVDLTDLLNHRIPVKLRS